MAVKKLVKASFILLVVSLVFGILLAAMGELKDKPEYQDHGAPLNLNDILPQVIVSLSNKSIKEALPDGVKITAFELDSNSLHLTLSCTTNLLCDELPKTFSQIGYGNVKITRKAAYTAVKDGDTSIRLESDVIISRENLLIRADVTVEARKRDYQNSSSEKSIEPDHECGITQNELNECAKKGEMIADAELNKLYHEQYNYLQTADKKAQLKKAQLAWIKYRDAVCEYEVTSSGGSMYPMTLSYCLQSVTLKRNEDLREYIGCRENGCPD